MFNIGEEVKDGKLILTIDLSKKGNPSKSGKSMVIASTEGNVPTNSHNKQAIDIRYGLNVYKPV